MKIYSKTCEYVLRVFSVLSSEEAGQRFLIRPLLQKARVPEAFTRKGLRKLVEKGLLKSIPGPGGGYLFRQSPKNVSLLSVIRMIDGENAFEGCIMRLPHCGDQKPCPVHKNWKAIKSALVKELEQKTFNSLMGSKAVQRRG